MLSPYQNRRWDSDFRTVQKLVSDGALGTVTRFELRFERFAPERGPGRSGGGTLLDFGSHLADQALLLLGPATSVYAEFRVREFGLEDDVFIAVTHASGARSQLWGSWSQSAPGPRYRVTGSTATYVLGPADTQENLLLAGETPATLGDQWGVEPPDTYGTLHTGTSAAPYPTERGRWDLFYPAFAGAVRGTNPPPVDPRDAIASLTLLAAARTSAETGAVVSDSYVMTDADADQLDSLLAEEDRLVFTHFDHETAWELGSRLRAAALEDHLPVAISIRRNGQCLFHAALPASSADNDAWLLRKAAVAERFGHSSYYVGCKFRADGRDFDVDFAPRRECFRRPRRRLSSHRQVGWVHWHRRCLRATAGRGSPVRGHPP